MRALALGLFALAALQGATIPMDSARGDQLFETQGCIQCHRLHGRGGTMGPDLGRVLDRAYTPSLLAGTLWNHAPAMWTAIKAGNVNVGDIDQQAAADLFATFYSERYFEMPGDAGRGKRLFASRSCEGCHGLTSSPNPNAKPVDQWQGLSDPIALVGAMWNHSADMWSELAQRKFSWPTMTPQELSDLLVYLRNVSTSKVPPVFRITAGEDGEKLFASKGCTSCHNAQRPIRARITLTSVAAGMWNHAPLLHNEPPRLDPDEMREVLSEYWARQFFQDSGDAARGKRLFEAKHCVDCHTGSGPGPVLTANAGSYNGMIMVSALWRHGPSMLNEMQQKHLKWPVFKAGEMADLMAWLNDGAKK
jgi:cytochrome c2